MRAHKDVLDGKVQVDVPGFELTRRRVAGRGRRGPPRRQDRGPRGHRRQLPGRGRRPPRRLHGARRQRAGARRRRPRARGRPRQRLPRRGRAGSGARSSAGPATCARGARCEEGSVLGDECFVGEDAVIGAGVKVYPFKTVEAGATSTPRSSGSRGAPAACSAATASPAWPTSTSPPSSPPRWPWPTPRTPQEGLDGRHVARLEPRGPHAQAGDDGRAQRRRASTCSTSRSRRCRSPASSSASPSASGGITVRLDGRRPAVGRPPVLRRRRPRHHRGRAAQDRAPVLPGGLPPGVRRRDRRHRLPAPGPRALHGRARGDGRRRRGRPTAASRSSSTTPTARRRSSCPTCWPSSGADVLGVNPYASTTGAMDFDRDDRTPSRSASLVRASGAHLGAVIDPDGEHLTLIDDEGRVLDRHTRPCWPSCRLVSGHLDRRPDRRCRST